MKNSLKHFFILLILFIAVLFNNSTSSYGAELYKIKTISFDISNSVIFIPVKTNPQSIITNDIKYTKLENANGVELELTNSTICNQPDNYIFSEGNLKEFKIEKKQNSTKLILIFNDKYNIDNLKIGNINNNLLITVNSIQPYNMNYYVNTYRENITGKDYKENLIISTKSIDTQQTLPVNNNDSRTDSSMSEINQAFANSNSQTGEVYTNFKIEDLTKNVKLRSKYYLFSAAAKDDTFKISGVGTISVQKPFMLTNPQRMVFDIPNSTINPDLHGKEITLSNGDIIKMAQFDPTTTRLVVTSEKAPQYMPVFQPDSQGIIIANPQNLLTTHLPTNKSNIVKFNFQKNNLQNNFFIEFDKPVMYGLKRTTEALYVYFLNAEKYNDGQFHSTIKNNIFSDSSMHLLSTGIRLKIPVNNKENLNTYISPDGKLFKIYAEIPKSVIEQKNATKIKELKKKEGTITPSPKYTSNNTVIVIDAGHGGKDCGALRGDITEKTITLDVSKMLQSILQKKGYKVYMTRTDDTYVSLEDRVNFSEGINPAAFVSVHVNSCNTDSPKGIETHYYHEESIELADAVHKNLIKKINTTNRGLFKSRFYVINHTTAPAILVEIGFISNPAERQELTTLQRQQATAEGIADGIIEFLKSLNKGK